MEPAISSARSSYARSVVIAAFVVVNIFYIVTTVYTQYSLREIDVATAELTDHTAVRIGQLTQSRDEVRWLELQVRRALSDLSRGRVAEPGAIDDARRQLRVASRNYVTTAENPEETRQAQMLAADARSLDVFIDQFLAMLRVADAPGARALADGPLRAAITRVGEDVLGAIDASARRAGALGNRIGSARRQSRRVAFGLAAASIGLTTFAAAVVLATIRRYYRLLVTAEERATQRADELDHFAGRVAHDIRSPLTATLFAIQQADRRIEGQPDVRSLLARGVESVARIVRLVDALLEFAQSGARPSESAPASLTAVVADVIAATEPDAAEANVAIEVERIPSTVLVCSAGVLTSIVSNLLSNAVKYTAKSAVGRVTVRAFDIGAAVRVEVDDTGPGVPIQWRVSIFDAYVRGPGHDQPGIGLGLATVKRLVQAHRGRVGVSDNAAGGSRFWFELPKASGGT